MYKPFKGRNLIISSGSQTAATAFGIFLLSLLGLLAGITTPDFLYFDETHYIPAARELLRTHFNIPTLNLEHPPLAKEIIALSIWVFGDNPLGWRVASGTFGALAITGVYLCGRALFWDHYASIWAAVIAALNQMLFVQARIAMLDIFSLAFILWGLAAFIASFSQQIRTRWWIYASGVFVGLATACKWSGLFVWGMFIANVAAIQVLQTWRTRFENARATDWYRPDLWLDVRAADWLLGLGLIPLAVYLASYVPMYGFSPAALLETQRRIFRDNITLATPHPYMSSWATWPFLFRPVWFLFEKASEDRYWAVLSVGNPVIFWSAIPALLICLRDWIVQRRRDAFLIVLSYASLYLAWTVLPRAIGFSFYYLPAATVASLALAYCLFRTRLKRWWLAWIILVAALLGFLFLLPISAASIQTSLSEYEWRMLLPTWR